MDPVWSGYITKGVDGAQFFELDLFDEFSVFLGRFAPDDKIEVILRKQTKKSSLPQNRYYWKVIVGLIVEHTGHTPDEIHSHLKDKFLGSDSPDGIRRCPSTSDLSTKEREEYHEWCRRWALFRLEVNIPLPEKVEP